MPRKVAILYDYRSFWLLLVLVIWTAWASSAQGAETSAKGVRHAKGLFNTVEFKGSLKALSSWTHIIQQAREQAQRLSRCTEPDCSTAALRWQKLIRHLKTLDQRAQLVALNRFFNRWPYRLDQEVYGVSDYWATPDEFLKNSGDCEDYCITKYFALRELGYRPDQLRIVVVLDTIRNIGHAVVAVYTKEGIFILDNLSDAVFQHTRYVHYWPQYSVNEQFRWAHARIKKRPSKAVQN